MSTPNIANPERHATVVYQQKLARMLATGEHSDLRVVCGPYEWAVHKAVLCPQSEFFNLACKPGRFKEGYTSVISLKAIDSDVDCDDGSCDYPECIKYMIGLCCGQDYSVQDTTEIKDGGSWLPKNHTSAEGFARLFATAVKYQNPGLQAAAITKFTGEMKGLLECILDTDPENIARAIYIVYGEQMPEEIRVLKEIIVTALWKNVEVQTSDEVKAALNGIHELCLDLVKANNTSQDLEEQVACDVCGQIALRSAAHAALVRCPRCKGLHFQCAKCGPGREFIGMHMCKRCMGPGYMMNGF